jgi:hypothetical protein
MSALGLLWLLLGSTVTAALALQAVPMSACYDAVGSCDGSRDYFASQRITFKYAKTVQNVTFAHTYVDFSVNLLDGRVLDYRLVQCGCDVPPTTARSRTVIRVPPTSAFVEETPALAMLTYTLAKLPHVAAVSSASYITSEEVQSRLLYSLVRQLCVLWTLISFGMLTDGCHNCRLSVGQMQDVGTDYTLLVNASMFPTPVSIAILGMWANITAFVSRTRGQISPLVMSDSLEAHPLGRAELVKVHICKLFM